MNLFTTVSRKTHIWGFLKNVLNIQAFLEAKI